MAGQSGEWVRARREEDAKLLLVERERFRPGRKPRTPRQRRLFLVALLLLLGSGFVVPVVLRLVG